MTMENQAAKVRRGETKTLRFKISRAAGAIGADWYVAASREAPPDACELAMYSNGGGITLIPDGLNLIVDVRLSRLDTGQLSVGTLHHELWLTGQGGEELVSAEGPLTVYDSLRS